MQEKEHRRSLRQIELLMQLDKEPAKTITELAERVGAQRPSISRSLRLLKEQGLVIRDSKGWHLTEAGKNEALTARDTLIETTDRIKNFAVRTGEVWNRVDVWSDTLKAVGELATPPLGMTEAVKTISSLGLENVYKDMDLGLGKMIAAMMPPLNVREIVGDLGLEKAITAMTPLLTTREVLGDSIKSLIEAQQLNGALLSDFRAAYLAGFDKIAKQNNLFLASAIDNIATIQQAEMAQFTARVSSAFDFAWMSTDLASVSQSYEQLFRHHMEVEVPKLPATSPSLAEGIIIPTATVTSYTGSLRDLVEAETETDIPPLSDQDIEEIGDQTLDPLLYELNPVFVEMRLGSWSVLHVGGPDRLRQAATSQRELLRQFLELVAPNSQLPQDQRQGPQIKARVRLALGVSKSDAEFIEAITQAVYSYYNQLNKYTHRNKKHEESLKALLHTGEGLLRFILAKISKKAS